MVDCRTARRTGLGVLLLFLAGAVGCSAGGSARTDYFASRSISHAALPGDGSVVGYGPRSNHPAWSASLAFVPVPSENDLAAGSR